MKLCTLAQTLSCVGARRMQWSCSWELSCWRAAVAPQPMAGSSCMLLHSWSLGLALEVRPSLTCCIVGGPHDHEHAVHCPVSSVYLVACFLVCVLQLHMFSNRLTWPTTSAGVTGGGVAQPMTGCNASMLHLCLYNQNWIYQASTPLSALLCRQTRPVRWIVRSVFAGTSTCSAPQLAASHVTPM